MWQLSETHQTSAGRVAAGRAGQGPALILAHGWPWSSYAWHRVIPALAEHFTVHWYDMPGFGQSELAPAEAPSLALQGRIFTEMCTHWGLTRPAVIAHDFGGATSLRAHLLHDQEFAALLLLNVVAMRPWGSAFFEHVKTHIEAFRGLPPHIHQGLAEAYIGGALIRPLPPEDLDALLAPWLSPAGQAAFYRQFALADEAYTAEIEPHFGRCRCPVSVLWGREDPWIPLARGAALAEAIGCRLTPLPGLGHLPQLEAPARVATALLEALPHPSALQETPL